MKALLIFIALVMANTPSIADTTFVEGSVSGRWTIDGSPYFTTGGTTVEEDDTLIIDPGVIVLLRTWGGMSVPGVLYAIGTSEDSIIFTAQNQSWRGITTSDPNTVFEYCSFRNSYQGDGRDSGTIFARRSIWIRHCSFIRYNVAIYIEWADEGCIEDCYFGPTPGWSGEAAIIGLGMNIIVSNCIFDHIGTILENPHQRIRSVELSNYWNHENVIPIIVNNCLFIESVLTAGGIMIYNNLFLNDSTQWIQSPWGADEDIDYTRFNAFIGHNPRPFVSTRTPIPEDLGVPSHTNPNGDSCDAYGNIFLDPRVVEDWAWPDPDFLLEDSPCIDAGDPNSPLDPDSTVADIGPFYYSQPNLGIDVDSLVFRSTFPNQNDTLTFTVRNRGDRRDLTFFWDEEELSNSFWFTDWNNDIAVLEPQASQSYHLIFTPMEVGEFLDTLTIFTNDRDQDTIRIPIRAEGANSVSDPLLSAFSFQLLGAFPNPFNSSTTISFSLSSPLINPLHPSSLAVFDLHGREVARLFDTPSPHSLIPSSPQTVVWNAEGLPAGIYLLRLESGINIQTMKIVLLR